MRLTLDGAFAVGRIPLPLDGTFAVGFAFWLLDPRFVFELVRAIRPAACNVLTSGILMQRAC